jgi:4-diphosphocytidyl-2-C-methyl-D-erythritol kinase
VVEYLRTHRLEVVKRIPTGGGLGGGSSDAAVLLRHLRDMCLPAMRDDELASLGTEIGADVPFFVYDLPGSNVECIGEIIEPFAETPLPLTLTTPPIHCDTGKVFRRFRQTYARTLDADAGRTWLTIPSTELLEALTPTEANDLLQPALDLCPQLAKYHDGRHFFSGSGSTFFSLS